MKKVIIETEKLKKVLENVKNGTSKEEFRPVFTGIFIEIENLELTMTTCDGYKIFTDSCNIVGGNNFKVVVPVFKIPKSAEKQTIIEVYNDFITFNYGQEKYSYKIIEGEFIDWKPLFKKENTFSIIFNSKYLQDALKNEKGEIHLEFSDNRSPVFINGRKLVLPIVHNN
ncbi:MAG: hypothetical protein HFJ55_04305 [Clostridia bacterium]|nr:hypothetical protein [Clostridia bacterium]